MAFMAIEFAITESLLLIFAQPIFLFIFAILVWSLQSFFITGISRRFIFPYFYSNPITTYLFAQVSIILHELSHFLSAIFTGSSIVSGETFITPTQGRVTAASEESAIGWFSRLVAALAPSFLPPLIFLAIFFVLSGQAPTLITSLTYPKTLYDFQTMLTGDVIDVLAPNLALFVTSMTDFTNPLTFLFIYVLIVCSIAAGPSEGDWNSTLQLFLSPVPVITLLGLFLFFNYAFSQFNIGFVIPLCLLIIFIFAVVAAGVFYSFLLARVIALFRKSAVSAILLVAVFFLVYYSVFYYVQDPVISFLASLVPSILIGLVLRKDNNKNNRRQPR